MSLDIVGTITYQHSNGSIIIYNNPHLAWNRHINHPEFYWIINNEKISDDIIIYHSHQFVTEWWNKHGALHRENGPARLGTFQNKWMTSWWINGHDITKDVKKWMREMGWRKINSPDREFAFKIRFAR